MNDLERMLDMVSEINQEADKLREILQPAEEIVKKIAIIEKQEKPDNAQLIYLYQKLDTFISEAEEYDLHRQEIIMLGPVIKGFPPNKPNGG